MKKYIVIVLTLICLLGTVGCSSNNTYTDKSNIETEDTGNSNIITSIENIEHDTSSSTTTMCIDTEYYTILVPASWNDDCFYEIAEGENYNYTLSFYDKASHEELNAGWLFSIKLLTEFEDYSVYPDYDLLGSIEVYRIGSYNIVITYPTDVQFSEETVSKYNEMYGSIPDILETISFNEECVFSKEPLPIDSIELLPVSKTADFYAELCAYVASNCVNYTKWWNNPTLSYTNPTHYYLGNITEENYSEKMEKAKQLVDNVYKAGYWEIRYQGYGTIKIGLYLTPADELYFCYKY